SSRPAAAASTRITSDSKALSRQPKVMTSRPLIGSAASRANARRDGGLLIRAMGGHRGYISRAPCAVHAAGHVRGQATGGAGEGGNGSKRGREWFGHRSVRGIPAAPSVDDPGGSALNAR